MIMNSRGHQIRSIAASLANHGIVALTEIMKSCFWASNTAFSSFYLKDVLSIVVRLPVDELSRPPTLTMGQLLLTTPSSVVPQPGEASISASKGLLGERHHGDHHTQVGQIHYL